jgi:hypothetical protein
MEGRLIKRPQLLERALASLAAMEADGGTGLKSRIAEIRSDLNHAVESAWREIRERGDGLPWMPPALHTVFRMLPGLLAADAPSPALLDGIGLCEEFASLAARVGALRAVPKPRAEKPPGADWMPPIPSAGASARLAAVLQEVVSEARAGLEAGLLRRNLHYLEIHASAVAAFRPTRELPAFDLDSFFGGAEVHVAMALRSVVVPREHARLKPDAPGIMAALATAEADRICRTFVAKNVRKVAAILDAKGDLAECEADRRSIDLEDLRGTFRVGFADGSGFQFTNGITWNRSVRGRRFVQFPLRFHDVVVANGERVGAASEKWMLDSFVRACAAPQARGGRP